jgi:hypothetical protein
LVIYEDDSGKFEVARTKDVTEFGDPPGMIIQVHHLDLMTTEHGNKQYVEQYVRDYDGKIVFQFSSDRHENAPFTGMISRNSIRRWDILLVDGLILERDWEEMRNDITKGRKAMEKFNKQHKTKL